MPESSNASSSSTTAPLEHESGSTSRDSELDLRVCRRMFYGGFAGLPWLWFIAWVHFRHAAKLPSADPQLATYARRCGLGACIGALLFVAWVVTVQTQWRNWGDFGRRIMLFVPEETDDEL